MNFKDIVGQREIVESLKNSVKFNKVGHAYVFSGPRGIGKRTVARIYAGMLLCDNPQPAGGCGECPPCRMSAEGSNPDFSIIETEDASMGIDEVRNLQSDIIIKPLYSRRKVYLIIDADKMTAQAQNCLLKTLEEPPAYATIILTTSTYEALLETIRSRTVKLGFKKNTLDEVKSVLNERYGKASKDASFIALLADGIIGTALELAGTGNFAPLREKAVETALRLEKGRLSDVFAMYDFFETNKGSVSYILGVMLLFYRDLLILKKTGKENMLINSDKKDIIVDNAGRFSVPKLMKNIAVIEKTLKNIKQNANYQLSIEVMLMRIQEESA